MRNRVIDVWAVVCCTLGLTLAAEAQTPDFTALDSVAIQELARHRAPGMAIAVVRGDRVIFMKGFGVANLETRDSVRPETVFHIASLSKPLTAAAVLSEVAAGRIRIDAPIGTYTAGLPPHLARLTTHQLLSHTSGLVQNVALSPSEDEAALGTTVRSFGDSVLLTEPGEIFSPSNPAYWLAGYVLESVTREPYADAMRRVLFAPLGMAGTTLRLSETNTLPFAQGYVPEPGGTLRPARLRTFTGAWPSGSVMSNVRDLSRFLIALLNRGQLEGKQVLDPRVVEAMTTAHASIPAIPEREFGYGMFLLTERGVRTWFHDGSLPGYGAVMRMAPDHRVGVVILGNQTGAGFPQTVRKAFEMLVPVSGLRPAAATVVLPTTPQDLARHPGNYRNLADSIEVLAANGQLLVRRGQRTRPLVKRSETRFDSDSLGSYVFTPGKGDKTSYISSGNVSYARVR